MRKDQLFNKFSGDYVSGLIIYRHLKTSKEKNNYDVLCAFPVHAYTESRSDGSIKNRKKYQLKHFSILLILVRENEKQKCTEVIIRLQLVILCLFLAFVYLNQMIQIELLKLNPNIHHFRYIGYFLDSLLFKLK